MDLALNNLQRLICHKTKQTKPNQIYQSWVSPCLFIGTSERKANQLPYLSFAFRKLFITCNLICQGGISVLLGSRREWDWKLCEPSFDPCLNGHSCLTESAQLSQRHRKQKYFVWPPWSPTSFPTIFSTDQPFVLLVVNSGQRMIHAVVSFFHLCWMPNREKRKTIPFMKNC